MALRVPIHFGRNPRGGAVSSDPMKRSSRRCLGLFLVCVGSGLCSDLARAADPPTVVTARSARWTGSYLQHDDSVRQLAARGDRSAALSVLRLHQKAEEPRLRALATALLYEHASRLGIDATSRTQLRLDLMKIAEDAQAPGFARVEAFRVLFNDSWTGRDAWYEQRLSDQTLRYVSDGVWGFTPLLGPLEKDPAHWVPILIPLLTSPGDVRANVADLLAALAGNEKQPARRDVAVALLPWLDDRSWVVEQKRSPSPRSEYISSLSRLDVKEAIPGLIHIVETEPDYHAARAASVLGHYRDARALPALRKGLSAHLKTDWERSAFTQAITACGGVTATDGVAALEAYARLAATPEGLEQLRGRTAPTSGLLAQGISLAHDGGSDDSLTAAVAQRLVALRSREPKVALALESPLFAWESLAAKRHVVARLADASLDDSLLRRALQRRTAIATSCGPELTAQLQRGGIGAGRAAAMIGQADVLAQVLRGADPAAAISLLHAAEVSDMYTLDEADDWGVESSDDHDGSMRLPIALVGPLLAHPQADLASAARTWLTHEGGALAHAWLQAGGHKARLVTPAASHYSIGGVTPGMTREAVAALKGSSLRVSYTRDGRVDSVTGPRLLDRGREILSLPSATAADVRRIFGRPIREQSGHIYATVGGFFWQYTIQDWTLWFSFQDDSFTLGERAPLHEISLQNKPPLRLKGTLR